jgi:prophage regulatory protein
MAVAQDTQTIQAGKVLVVDAIELARLLDMSVRTIRRLDCSGKLPRPVRIGGAVRWLVADIEAWLAAGCPDRQRWEAMRGSKTAARAG